MSDDNMLTVQRLEIQDLWKVMAQQAVKIYWHFRGPCSLHLQCVTY